MTVGGLIATVLLLLALAPPAWGHRPYSTKNVDMALPDEGALRLELWHGDGIFAVDPVRAQIRSATGAILGYTPTGSAAVLRCRAGGRPEDCRVFVFNFDLLPEAWIPDPASLDWTAPTREVRHDGGWDGPYPEWQDTQLARGFRRDDSLVTRAIGTGMLALARWRGILVSVALLLAGLWLGRVAWRRGAERHGGTERTWLAVTATILAASVLSALMVLHALVLYGLRASRRRCCC
jgi:hypothetical protein